MPTVKAPAASPSFTSETVSPTFMTAPTEATSSSRMALKTMKGQGRPFPPTSSAVTTASGA